MTVALERETETLLERRAARAHVEKSELANSIIRARLEDEETAEELSRISDEIRSGERTTVSWASLKEELALDD